MQLAQCLGPWGGLRSGGKREGAQPGVKEVGEPSRKAPSRGCPGVVINGVGEEEISCVWNSKGQGAQEQGGRLRELRALRLFQSLGCDLESREPRLPPPSLIC